MGLDSFQRDLMIPLAPEGGAATPAAICADVDAGADAGVVVASGGAARVTLARVNPGDDSTAIGTVTVDPALIERVVGLPEVTIVGVGAAVSVATVSNLRRDPSGFLFDVAWNPRVSWDACHRGDAWMCKTLLQVRCGDAEVRTVESTTTIRVCEDRNGWFSWASSGDECVTCAQICEMAPSPILPEAAGDDLPLAAAVNLHLRPLARVGGNLILLAEHDGGKDRFAYRWTVSAGHIEQLAHDVVLWRLPAAGPAQLAQVSLKGADAAAVASLRWGLAA